MEPVVDTGRIYSEGSVALSKMGGFLDALIEKKRLGGELLARLLSESVARGTFPDPIRGTVRRRVPVALCG
jgi:hypothetical protein